MPDKLEKLLALDTMDSSTSDRARRKTRERVGKSKFLMMRLRHEKNKLKPSGGGLGGIGSRSGMKPRSSDKDK